MMEPIFAYLDPGTGSYVIQLIAAFVLTGSASLALFWKKIKTKFKGNEENNGE